ncbi:MAG: glycosyltransferase family 2 protein [Acholeplasmataceae bacterium]|nr:glycosyltransferase family 2 protein [Acholeplasmataceae bacterium]
MKLISFIIPSYNSQDYIKVAIDSLLIGKEDIEIIIVNDGSQDQTLAIANIYKKSYPNIVKVIDKENGGHGSTINAGLKIAKGLYFKVIDSDDWVDQNSLIKLINQIKEHLLLHQNPDLYITNFVYEHVSDHTQYERDYSQNFPENIIFNWTQTTKKFKYSKTLLMHALFYKTTILKKANLVLPEHTFYVDNIVSHLPLPFVESVYYMKIPLYRYFIGRPDQSVTLENITRRYQQQIRVFNIISKEYTYEYINNLPKGLKAYMKHNITAMMMITQMFTVASDTKERRSDLRNLWKNLKTQDKKLYHFLKYYSLNTFVHFLPWKLKSLIMVKSYIYLTKKIKLG